MRGWDTSTSIMDKLFRRKLKSQNFALFYNNDKIIYWLYVELKEGANNKNINIVKCLLSAL